MAWLAFLVALFCFVFALFGVSISTPQHLLYAGLAFVALGFVLGDSPARPWRQG